MRVKIAGRWRTAFAQRQFRVTWVAVTGSFVCWVHGPRVRQRADYFGCGTDGRTPLAEGQWYAASQLIACPETRKIILALTDGDPDDETPARDILSRCAASAIEMVDTEVVHLFERSITNLQMAELRSRLFELSRDLLIAE